MKDDNSTQVVTQLLRRLATEGTPGARLPSVRELQQQHRVSPLTVKHAMTPLIAEGLIEALPGHGTFVRARPGFRTGGEDFAWQSVILGVGRPSGETLGSLIALPTPGAITLTLGYLPADLQACAQLTASLTRAARRPAVWDRLPIEGLESLRGWFAAQLQPGLSPGDVQICPGSQAAIATTFRALTSPGDAVLLESPTYVGALAAAQAARLRVIPVPTDAQGVRPDLLREALHTTGAKVFYCQPSHSNPSGSILSAPRRTEVLEAINAHNAFLIEDDWARDLGFEGTTPLPLATQDPGGHIIYIRSLTKASAPGLRIGALIARGPARARLKAARTIDDFYVAGPLQEAALQLLTSPVWARHLRAMRAALLQRRDALLAALRTHLKASSIDHVPRGGFHLWLRLPPDVADLDVTHAAARAGVIISPGRYWFPAESTSSFVRLTFAAAPAEQLRRAAKLLATVLATGEVSA
ncbi:MAG TPA: PLP-dependent aminotransferase family protein [Steroidobacteraceae bacterium]|jgi:DNA-binding transcriptional MocR family regulator|nr:PLP-dependent aminotransferase family protein [Steroidobacteraceae bacterium]